MTINPEKATVTAGSEVVYQHRLNYDDRDTDGRVACICGQWREPDDMAGDEYDWGHHMARAVLSAALPYLSTQDDTAAREGEFAGFYLTNDDGYLTLAFYPHADEDGEHVRSADAGTSLDELVRAARRHAASLRGEQGE